MARPKFTPGITTLLNEHKQWLRGHKIALLSHKAAIDSNGTSSADLLAQTGCLKSVFSPEHGFFGAAGPGEPVTDTKHPALDIPVYSLYGKNRKPTPEIMSQADTIVCDLQNLAARPYTYLSTLRLTLEAAAEEGKTVIVADRPIPLPNSVDGPTLDPDFESFVSNVDVPMVYGMTPAEVAIYIKKTLNLDVNLKIAAMKGYNREEFRMAGWPAWISPSPGIVSWESGMCYASTVFSEALPMFSTDRTTSLAFRTFEAKGVPMDQLCAALNKSGLRGVQFHNEYQASCSTKATPTSQIRITVTKPELFKPVRTGVTVIHETQKLSRATRVWNTKGTRKNFFDKLFGCDNVRQMLTAGCSPAIIAKTWEKDLRKFKRARNQCLLYKKGK